MNWLREIKAFPRDYIFDESTTNSTDWIWEDNDWKLYLIFVVNQTISFQEFLNISSEDENYYRRISLDNTEYFVYWNRVKKLNWNNYMKEKEIK